MTMVDKLVALEAKLDELPGAVDRRKLGDRLKQSLEALRNAHHQISRINAIFELADLTDFDVNNPQNDALEKLRDEAWEVGNDLQAASTEGALRDAIHDYERLLPPVLAGAERAVRGHWTSIVDEKFRPIDLLGELLERIGVAGDLGQRMRDCARRGLSSGNVAQLTETVARARSLLSELAGLQQERATAIGAGDVGTFINALADRRATLAMVTPEVRAWLSQNQALDRLSVTPH